MSVILLRHTRPEGAEGLCYGRTDLALAPGFEGEVARLAGALPAVTRIVTSPLSRCRRLAEALAAARGQPVAVEEELIEMDFGRWEATPWDAIPRAELDAWAADFSGANPHGGETVADLAARARRALDRAAAGARPVLAVTHAGIIKAALVAAGDPNGWKAETAFGDWRRIDWP